MKTTKLLACLVALATAAGAVSALAAPGFSLGLGGQYWNIKDADILDEDGMWGGSLIGRIQPCDYLGIDFRVGAVGVWDSDTYRMNDTKYETDAKFWCCPLELGLVLTVPLSDAVTLYGGPGVGYYYYDIDIETSTRHHHHWHSEWNEHIKLEDDFGWFAVAGLKFRLTPGLSLFGEARYTDTETNLKSNKSVKFDCSGFGAEVGLMFGF